MRFGRFEGHLRLGKWGWKGLILGHEKRRKKLFDQPWPKVRREMTRENKGQKIGKSQPEM